jgi:alanine racemase
VYKRQIKICSIVKADAYGHGMKECGKALSDFGSDYLGTADYNESIELSDHLKKYTGKHAPVLCLGILTGPEFFKDIIKRDIEVTIADIRMTSLLNNFAKSNNKIINVQLQADSGINRIGFKLKDTYSAVKKIRSFKNLNLRGIYSHLATGEVPESSYSKKQQWEFKAVLREIENDIMKLELKHISNSGGILNSNDHFFNMVRPGISLYGYYPDRKKVLREIGIKPVMTLKTKVKFIKTLEKGQSISYGRKYYTKAVTEIASLPVGYGDGYSRLLSNKSKVLINGKLYNTVGAVCMDWVMADLGKGSGVRVNDEVILFGKELPAYYLSEIMKTIPYEITCNISKRVKRIYTH